MKYLLFLMIATVLLTGCNRYGIKSGTPACIKTKIIEYSKTSHCNNPDVKEYTFQAKKVYVFEPGTCGADMTSDVYDSECNLLGRLGGFIGNTKINAEEFSNAKLIRTIWKK